MTGTGAISDSQATAWWIHRNAIGDVDDIMIAPDSRMKPFRGYERVLTRTVAETEQMSRRMARQQYNRMRSLRVDEHLRHQKRREQIKTNCRLRLASGCISAEDERLTRMTLASLERKDELFYNLIANEPDLTRTSLVIEQKESPTGMAQFSGKKRGLADSEINAMVQLAGETA